MNLKILTYNVFGMPWGYSDIESILLWALYKTDAEILCFQEVFSENSRTFLELFCNKADSLWNCYFPNVKPTYLSRVSSSFACATGLCVLIRKQINLVEPPVFVEFKAQSSIDKFVRKGFFHFHCEKEGVPFHFLTTHFQSDFTEFKCRIRHQSTRIFQEIELYRYAKHLKNLFVVGDFNMSRFYHFHIVNENREATFHETGEALDHCVSLKPFGFTCHSAIYFQSVNFSDHIPVLFSLVFQS
jgi:exonuclease III